MCGIVGTYGRPGTRSEWLNRACEALRHRGPDGAGIWEDASAGVAIGQTRLAIQDLSAAGRQPMASADGRFQIVFNGEIYNQYELREQLGERAWRGHSDTETLLACLSEWGVERTLQALTGMFAFGLFDLKDHQLILARDRFGEKPLYYGFAGSALVFGSELRPLRLAPSFDSALDSDALAIYMRRSCVPAPLSIYSSIRKLPPGTWLTFDAESITRRALPEPRTYWSAIDAAERGQRALLDCDDTEAFDELDALLRRSIKGQMLSDVPIGAFLSGGIDSSLVVALMQAQSSQPVRTFSIGFADEEFDESGFARQVAAHLGTAHTEMNVEPRDALQLVPSMPRVYDEPFADSSQLPTTLVAQLARKHVTVALSGDAGDELFGGYPQHFTGPRVASLVREVPRWARLAAARLVRCIPAAGLSRLVSSFGPLVPQPLRGGMAGDRIHKGADLLSCDAADAIYDWLVSYWWSESPVLGRDAKIGASVLPSAPDLMRRMMLRDTVTYLSDDILAKVDRAAMSLSLETRVPLLDHRVYEFAWRMPTSMLVREGRGKWPLRSLLLRYVPGALVDRPKKGFAVPLAAWLRGPLRSWAEDLLDSSCLRQQGYLDTAVVARRWKEHVSGARNWHHELWNVLMFQAWMLETRRGP